jgi:hypothetical protein
MEKISVTWADESKTTVLCTYPPEEYSWEELFDALKRQNALIDRSDAPVVDVIVDVRVSNWMPKGGTLLTGIRKLKEHQHQRQGETIIVGARGFVASMAMVASKLLRPGKQGLYFVNSMDEAQKLLKQFDERRQAEKKAAS